MTNQLWCKGMDAADAAAFNMQPHSQPLLHSPCSQTAGCCWSLTASCLTIVSQQEKQYFYWLPLLVT
jgi:hypothetical protein